MRVTKTAIKREKNFPPSIFFENFKFERKRFLPRSDTMSSAVPFEDHQKKKRYVDINIPLFLDRRFTRKNRTL
jgi:hypothetical protein